MISHSPHSLAPQAAARQDRGKALLAVLPGSGSLCSSPNTALCSRGYLEEKMQVAEAPSPHNPGKSRDLA